MTRRATGIGVVPLLLGAQVMPVLDVDSRVGHVRTAGGDALIKGCCTIHGAGWTITGWLGPLAPRLRKGFRP